MDPWHSRSGHAAGTSAWGVRWARLDRRISGEAVVSAMYRRSRPSFWLDSSRHAYGSGRFSFLGDTTGPLSETLTYRVGDGRVRVDRAGGPHWEEGSIFDVLERRLDRRRLAPLPLPFDFQGGYVGFLGYEMRSECGYDVGRHRSPTPDAVWMFADRLVVIDHRDGATYLLALHDGDAAHASGADDWIRRAGELLSRTGEAETPGASPSAGAQTGADGPTRTDARPGAVSPAMLRTAMTRGPERYRDDVLRCLEHLRSGLTYEICLTDNLRVPFHGDDLAAYLRLRSSNPAPYAALLRLNGFTVHCSSPERFVAIDRQRRIQSKPIKGTAARGADRTADARLARELAADPKTRAENLIIVDLLRNDLSRVCRPGSIRVDPLMAVESYETVHQLVSTVHGDLADDVTVVEAVRHCFPGGSMTGAPKRRTLQLIDAREDEARGVYSGTIGALGLDGTADLNIVIRTAVRVGDTVTVGAGGAIVLESDPDDELDELLLKAAAPLRAFVTLSGG